MSAAAAAATPLAAAAAGDCGGVGIMYYVNKYLKLCEGVSIREVTYCCWSVHTAVGR